MALNLELEPDLELCEIEIDVNRLLQVIANLCSNSLKFTNRGSITITGKIIESDLQISVKDTGAGISKEDQS